MGNKNVADKVTICKSFVIIEDKSSLEINPPAEIVVRAKLTESKNRIFTTL